jgi:hypothetical protein
VSSEPHDSWVIGDEDYVSIHFMGAELYANWFTSYIIINK